MTKLWFWAYFCDFLEVTLTCEIPDHLKTKPSINTNFQEIIIRGKPTIWNHVSIHLGFDRTCHSICQTTCTSYFRRFHCLIKIWVNDPKHLAFPRRSGFSSFLDRRLMPKIFHEFYLDPITCLNRLSNLVFASYSSRLWVRFFRRVVLEFQC